MIAKNWEEAKKQVNEWKSSGLTVVFTNGCFDILHRGHVEYLSDAKACGNKLVLALNSDSSVQKLKGDPRPIQNQEDRTVILDALESVDMVVVFDQDTPAEIIQTLLQENNSQDQSVYLQVTRGTASYRDHSFPETIQATVFIMVNSLHTVNIEKLKQGVCAISLDDIRWQACNIKATALLANVMLRQQATEKACAEAILIRNGFATEGAATSKAVSDSQQNNSISN